MIRFSLVMTTVAVLAIFAAPMMIAAADSARPSACALAASKIERDISSLPQGAIPAPAQWKALIQLGAAARAACAGDESLSWNRLLLSKYDVPR